MANNQVRWYVSEVGTGYLQPGGVPALCILVAHADTGADNVVFK